MSPAEMVLRRLLGAWLEFWFGEIPPQALLAVMRVGTALLLLYSLFVRSFDLNAEFAGVVWSQAELLRGVDPIAWPFSIFRWVDSPYWLWSMHALAVLIATAFLAGVLTPLMAALSLVFQLSYAHHNPVMLLGLDGLLILALAYLSLVPSGAMLSVFSRLDRGYPRHLAYLEERDPRRAGLPWSGLIVRVLQVHLCVLYFQSALGKLSTDWLAGAALWHPRLIGLGTPYSLARLQAEPYLTSLITYGLVLFELFYGVLIWVPRLRYAVLAVAVVVHLSVGIAWNLLPFNLMMLVLNIAFVPPRHLEMLMQRVRPFLVIPWFNLNARA